MKRDKFLKRTLISLALIMILTFSGIAVVLGGGSSGDDAGGDGGARTCSDCDCRFYGKGVYGVRLSLVDWETGARIAGTESIDVFASSSIGSAPYGSSSLYMIKNDNKKKYNRMEMLDSVIKNTTSNPTLDSVKWGSINKYTASQLNWTSYKSKLDFNFDATTSSITYSAFVESLYDVMTEEISAYNSSADINKLKLTNKLFTTLGINQIQTYSKEDLEGIHLAIEPIITIGVVGASNIDKNNYHLFYGTPTQLAYAFQAKNCTSASWSGWSLSESILKSEFNVVLHATSPCNTTDNKNRCTPKNWPAVTKPSGDYALEALNSQKKSYGVGYIWLGDLGIVSQEGCDISVGYLNNLYKNGKITKTKYKQHINNVIKGKFQLTDSSTGQIYRVSSAQSWELLTEANYDKYNGGYAACSNIPTGSKNCDTAIAYINKTYTKGSSAYHDAVAKVRNGTFEYEDYISGKLTKIKIDKAYNDPDDYAMLVKSIYTKFGGVAKCDSLDCSAIEGGTADIDNCSDGKTYFKDIELEEAWLTCEVAYTKDGTIYSSDNTGHEAVETTNGGVVGNKEYCEVFCYEEVETSFPTHVKDVKAGQIFRWGSNNGVFGKIKVTKKCSTQSHVSGVQGYRFSEWETDFKSNQTALVKNYMKKGAYEKAANSITITSTGSYYTCNYKCLDTCKIGSLTYECNCKYTGCKRYTATASSTAQSESYTHSYLGKVSASVGADSATVNGYTTLSAAKNAAIQKLKDELIASANSQYSTYTGRINTGNSLLSKIKQCTNNIKYVNETSVRFTFSEPVNSVYGANSRKFSYDDELSVSGSYNTSNVDTSQCSNKSVYSYSCSGSGSSVKCTPTKQTVKNCTMVKWNVNGTYTYKYPSNYFQWYSLKSNGTLVNKNKKGSEDEAFFYSLGYGLPTAFSLTEGTYSLKVTVDNLGDNATTKGDQKYNVDHGHFVNLANSVSTKSGTGYGFNYACTYEVENDIFGNECQYDSSGKLTKESPKYCDSTKNSSSSGSLVGLDITYRAITLLSKSDSMDKAFPSVDGSGREPAGNWKIAGETAIRDILNADIYKNSMAMYEIMLDVNGIQQIRKDNEKYFDAGKDPYTSYYDANNAQKVYCATGDDQQKYCASTFISKLNTGSGYNYRLLGTCLPTANTLDRAESVLKNGCKTSYTYPTINWAR